jgi:hypothetical protein
MKMRRIGLTVTVLTGIVTPAGAHHSFSMFDADKTVTLKGVVKELEWGQSPCLDADDGGRSGNGEGPAICAGNGVGRAFDL